MRRREQVSAYLGALIEWYDFYLYGFAAATVLNVLFFPQLDAAAGIIASFATLAVGFVARPVGALIFAHYGDRVGRRDAGNVADQAFAPITIDIQSVELTRGQ